MRRDNPVRSDLSIWRFRYLITPPWFPIYSARSPKIEIMSATRKEAASGSPAVVRARSLDMRSVAEF
jgi:hypothetical protein